MNKSWFYIGMIGSLAILTTSCGDSNKPTTPAASPSPTTSPTTKPSAAVPGTTTPVASTPGTPTATTPTTVAGTSTIPGKQVSVDVAAGLIAPTDGDNWAKTVAKGRTNPFQTLAIQPVEVPIENPIGANGLPINPGSKPTGTPGVKSGVDKPLPKIKVAASNIPAIAPDGGKTFPGLNPGTSSINPKGVDISRIPRTGINRNLPKIVVALNPVTQPVKSVPGTATIKPLPLPGRSTTTNSPVAIKPVQQSINPTSAGSVAPAKAEPTLARNIGVSGVIEVEGKTQVIVKLPNENFSRYVDIGDRISDGKVRVKRVEGAQTLTPVVILEEAGVEITRNVGDKPDATNQPK
jgi:hypothetical protein